MERPAPEEVLVRPSDFRPVEPDTLTRSRPMSWTRECSGGASYRMVLTIPIAQFQYRVPFGLCLCSNREQG